MSKLADVPVSQLREAVKAWQMHFIRPIPTWCGFLSPEIHHSIFERCHEFVDEIERLRAKESSHDHG